MPKPFSESCEQNKQPILEVIQNCFADRRKVLEIGSGTGQHAVFFAQNMPHLIWQTSDRAENHVGIHAWLAEAHLPNTRAPLLIDVADIWPEVEVDAVFSANTTHIMHWDEVEAFFAKVGKVLPDGGLFVLYGPFNYGGQYTSASNARFDDWLKARDPLSGVRNFEDLDKLAQAAKMHLEEDVTMPANNRTLCWKKQAS
jgi:cyclopropane fatty-acyl-phospholipid synthase-like methyltransferase